jgi:hypothetical protein
MDFNRGLKLGTRETDYILGSSPVIKKEINTNWKDWKPEHEIQAKRYFDTVSCVSYSATDVIEYLFTWALNNNQISQADVKWLKDNGYFKNGLINFSDRFVAILGETTKAGAFQYKVGDAIRKYGLIPQDMLPTTDDIKSFEEYIGFEITQEMLDLGKEFIKRFPINYEWAFNIDALKYAPIQVCVSYADGEGILCPTSKVNHAIVAINATDDYIEVDDSYQRQFKKYCHKAVYSMMLYTVKFNNMTNERAKILKDKNSSAVGIFLPATSEDVIKSYCANMGIEVPIKHLNNGITEIDWDLFIEGEYQLHA